MSAALPLLAEELAAFRRRPRLSVPDAIEYDGRILPVGPRRDRPYRNQDAPHLIFPMEVFGWPSVREEVVAAANQVGKTTFAHNCLLVATRPRPLDWAALEHEFNLPYPDGTRMGLADRAKAVFRRYRTSLDRLTAKDSPHDPARQ